MRVISPKVSEFRESSIYKNEPRYSEMNSILEETHNKNNIEKKTDTNTLEEELKEKQNQQAESPPKDEKNKGKDEYSDEKFNMLTQITSKNTGNNIKVFIRFRPLNEMESGLLETGVGNICTKFIYPDIDSSDEESKNKIENKECKCVKIVSPNGVESRPYYFDKIFEQNSKQIEIYNNFGPVVVKDVLSGYNGTVFAYGQSGSGKTYTMYGQDIYDDEIKGFIPRLISDIFDYADTADENINFLIKMSYLQIYKEVIYDLITGDNNLKIKESPVTGIFVDKLTEVCLTSFEDFMYYIDIGQQNRIVSETRLNSNSSRSHSILIVEISQTNRMDNITKTGKLNLVDLAGSEKISKTGAVGETLEEAKKINLSLSALGNIIHALTSGADHIPYRDSKLTRILQESLGGNFKTSLIVTCSPHSFHLEETISSLNFAERAKKIKNKAKLNIKLTYEELQKLVRQLKIKLKLSQNEIEKLKALIPGEVLEEMEEKEKEKKE